MCFSYIRKILIPVWHNENMIQWLASLFSGWVLERFWHKIIRRQKLIFRRNWFLISIICLMNSYQQQSGFPSLLPLQPGDVLQWETALKNTETGIVSGAVIIISSMHWFTFCHVSSPLLSEQWKGETYWESERKVRTGSKVHSKINHLNKMKS